MKKLLLLLLGIMICSDASSQVVKTQIGRSKYDLQTNGSIQRRVAVHPTSKDVIVCFTGSNLNDGDFSDRGSGYAYYSTSASQWRTYKNDVMTTPADTFFGRIEATRIGWPNPMFVGSSEVIVSHKSSAGSNGLYQASRTMSGTGTWANKDVTSGTETWPRAAESGSNIIAVSSHFQADFNEVSAGLMFIKSTDGGSTWSSPAVIPGIDKDNYTVVGGDNYGMDVNGNNVALLTGVNDVTLYKSTDLGTNWTKVSIFPTSANFIADPAILPRENRSDGAFSVIIDTSGTAHCFWPRYVTFSNPSQGAGTFIDVTRSGIMYWNENMGTNPPIIIPKTDFIREDPKSPLTPIGRFNTEGGTISYMGTGGGYRSSTTTWPSTGMDAAGNLYLTYGYNRGIIDSSNSGKGIDADVFGYNMYDVYAMKSTDGGTTWIGPTNVSNTIMLENSYPSMARFVDDKIHIVYQEDDRYGNAIATTEGSTNGTGSQAGPIYTDNNMVYATMPVSSIVNPVTDITNPTLRFNNKFQNLVISKDLQYLQAVLFIGCNRDTVTGEIFSKSKKFLMDNYIEFSEDSSLLTVIGLDTIDLNVPGSRLIRITGRDAAGNPTLLSPNGTMFDTINMGIVVVEDVTAPTITLLGKNTEYVYLGGAAYTEPGAQVSDDNPCSATSYTTSGTVDENTKGEYIITYNAEDGAMNTSSTTRKVIVGKEPTAKITEESLVDLNIKAKGTTSLDIDDETNPKFEWYVKKGNTKLNNNLGSSKTSNTLDETINASFPTFDQLCLEVTNSFNNAFSKDPSVECVELKHTSSGSSISQANEGLEITIFPNPNNGLFNFNINGNKSNDIKLTITNMEGKIISEKNLKVQNGTVPFQSNLSKGTYFITTEIDNRIQLDKVEIR